MAFPYYNQEKSENIRKKTSNPQTYSCKNGAEDEDKSILSVKKSCIGNKVEDSSLGGIG